MGNMSCGGDRLDPKAYSFTPEEFDRLKTSFTEMSSIEEKTLSRKIIGKKAFKTKFSENPGFGLKLYNWTKNIMENKRITLETFFSLVEALVKDHPQSIIAQYVEKGLDKFELFLMISLGRHVDEKDNLSSRSITYTQSLQFLEEVFNAFHLNDSKWTAESGLAAKLICVNLFKNEQMSVTWQNFTLYIREALPYINDMIPIYFTCKFIDRKLPFQLPILDSQSRILNQELLSIFHLSNPYFQQAKKLNLLYSLGKNGHSFEHLAQSIKGYENPTLILIKHAPKAKDQTFVFGGFSKVGWKDEARSFGNTECCVFSLIPKFQSFSSVYAGGEPNYLYLNSKRNNKGKVGLGFGGKEGNGARIWIDEDIEHESYVNSNDGAYQKGDLADSSTTKLNIAEIEIWGISNEADLGRKRGSDMLDAYQGTQATLLDVKGSFSYE